MPHPLLAHRPPHIIYQTHPLLLNTTNTNPIPDLGSPWHHYQKQAKSVIYLHHSTLLSDAVVEAVQIKGLLANGRHCSDRRSLLLQKGQQLVQEWATVHLVAHVIQLG